jgi:hypothetical protein
MHAVLVSRRYRDAYTLPQKLNYVGHTSICQRGHSVINSSFVAGIEFISDDAEEVTVKE